MTLFNKLFASKSHPTVKQSVVTKLRKPRTARFEQFEERRMLAADVMLGGVYFEEATGDDSEADILQVSFVGGAEGTTLDRIVISGDKNGDGLTINDSIFDTVNGGAGAFEAVGYSLIESDGFLITGVEVLDGGTEIAFTFSGFDAGEKLVFSADVDEFQGLSPIDGSPSYNALVEGGEFEFSSLVGEFSASGHVDLTLSGYYFDFFDDERVAAEVATGLTIDNLPDDRYEANDDKTDRTAGVVAHEKQLELASLSGHVYHDLSDDGFFDSTESPIPGVTVELLDASGNGTGITTTTDENGYYEFRNLEAGIWGAKETQPTEFFDGKDTLGTKLGTVGNDIFTGVELQYGDHATDYNFGEILVGSIAGRVHANTDGDCDFDNPEILLAGVVIELLDAQGVVIDSTSTDEKGEYKFDRLAPGVYGVREIQPADYYDGGERVGTSGGTLSDDLITDIQLTQGNSDGVNYDFCEHVGATLSGYVYHDQSDDGVFDTTESPIAGVTVELLDASGVGTGITTTTNAEGYYEFTNLAAGTWGVLETQPTAFYDGKDTAGSNGGTSGNDIITGAVLEFGDHATDYNFGELLAGSIAGRVHASTDGDCDYDDPDILLEGVLIELLDASGTVIDQTQTLADGTYRFDGLRPGEYQVREQQPTGYFDGSEQAGTAGGIVSDDLISAINIGSGEDAVEYDFCEHIGATLSGYVYHDQSNDGIRDANEDPIAGVTLKLLDGDGNDTGIRAVTDSNGHYTFSNLAAGTYCVMEIHPDNWIDGIDTEGSLGGSPDNPGDMICEITLDFGDNAVEYNFGELLPGSIAGRVHSTNDGDCDFDDPGPPIEGVEIQLLNSDGVVIKTTTTDANGEYLFDDLPPGDYSVNEIQPEDYFDGTNRLGSGGGIVASTNQMTDIEVGSGEDLVHYDFCEMPPAMLAGYVFIDGEPIVTNEPLPEDISEIRDGLRTADDTPLARVTLQLINGETGEPILGSEMLSGVHPDGAITTTTDANGYYEFLGLSAGIYGVVEIGPAGLIDGIDTPGTEGGEAINPSQAVIPGSGVLTNSFKDLYGNDVIFSVVLHAGDASLENNFSEVEVIPIPPPLTPETQVEVVNPVFEPLTFNVDPPIWPLLTPEPDVLSSFGGSSSVGYTWHLSVINGGNPRSVVGIPGGTIEFASASTEPSPWSGAERSSEALRQAKWQLLATDIEGADLSQFAFGNKKAIPVAGDWDGDGIADIGVFIDGDWYLDLNGDGRWDKNDLWAQLGSMDDLPVTGDWDGDGKTDIGIFGPAWPRDPHAIRHDAGMPDASNHPGPIANKVKNVPPIEDEATSGARLLKKPAEVARREDVIDHVFHFGVAGDTPVAGDWNGDGIRTIGVYRDGAWMLDSDGDGRLTEKDQTILLGEVGDRPIVGDWDGDGTDELGVFRSGDWLIDANSDGELEAMDSAFADAVTAEPGQVPVTGDWDGDGADEPGVFSPVSEEAGNGETIRVSRRAG